MRCAGSSLPASTGNFSNSLHWKNGMMEGRGGEGSFGTALASEPPTATHELAHLELKEPTVTTIDYCLGAL